MTCASRLLIAVALAVVTRAAPADPLQDYDVLTWTALERIVLLSTRAPAVPGPSPADPALLEALNADLGRLMNTLPPPARMRMHLVLLPAMQECGSALMAVHESAAGDDPAQLEATREWLFDAFGRMREVIDAMQSSNAKD